MTKRDVLIVDTPKEVASYVAQVIGKLIFDKQQVCSNFLVSKLH
jgi:hypothetical protein